MPFAMSRAPVAGHRTGSTLSQTSTTTTLSQVPVYGNPQNRPGGLPSRPAKRQKVDVIVISDEEGDQDQDALEKEPEQQPGNTGHSTNPKSRKQETAASRKEHYKRFIRENVAPHISSAVTKLPVDRYHVNMIAQKTSCIIAKTPRFYSHYLDTNGQFSEADKLALSLQVPKLVERLSQLAEYQLPLTPSSGSSPVPSRSSLSSLDIPSDACSPPSSLSPSIAPISRELQRLSSPPAEVAEEFVRGYGPGQRRPVVPRVKGIASPYLYDHITKRPYLTVEERQQVSSGTRNFEFRRSNVPAGPVVLHLDFSQEEVDQLIANIHQRTSVPNSSPITTLADTRNRYDKLY